MTSLRCFKLVSVTKVSIGTSLWPLKLVGFFYGPMRRRKDVSNRSVSFTYLLWHCDDVSACSATSRPIWDLTETSHAWWVDLLLIQEQGKRHHVLIENFNTYMHNHTLHYWRKHFCCYCLQAFSAEGILKHHIKIVLKSMVNKGL